MATGRLILGTSGFWYDHWRERFYPPDLPQRRWLEYYAEHFDAVELNVTFYRLPKRETFAAWAEHTPPDFRFIVKGSRLITHFHRLRDVDEALRALHTASSALSEKLACLLWQLPPEFPADAERLDDFCSLVSKVFSAGVRHVFEFRDPSWFSEEVMGVLRSHGHALVWPDPVPEGMTARERTAHFAYLRFHHGHGASGRYDASELEPLVAEAVRVLESGGDVFALFNNDAEGWAVVNARQFGEAVGLTMQGALH